MLPLYDGRSRWQLMQEQFFAGYFKAHPTLTEGCTIGTSIRETCHLGFDTFCDFMEIDSDEFYRYMRGEVPTDG